MTTPKYSLLDERFIPARLANGQLVTVGFLELFRLGREVEELAVADPVALVALYRLLLVIVHRALTRSRGSWHGKDVATWISDGLPTTEILDYLEQWRDRFWLFHPQHPFMQVAALDDIAETRERCKPWTHISLASSSGNSPLLFDHALDETPATREAGEVLLLMLGFLQFVPGGLVKAIRGSDNAGPLANSAAVIPLGRDLVQTLCLCLHPSRASSVDDLPAWERPALGLSDLQASPSLATGPNDRYSRQSRAILLLPEADGSIRWLRFAAGLALQEDPDASDPMVSYRQGSNGPVRLGFTEGRAIWRDLPVLLPATAKGAGKAAAVMGWASILLQRMGQQPTVLPLWIAGVASDQAKLLRWRIDRIQLPAALLLQPEPALIFQDALEQAESLFQELRKLASGMVATSLPQSQHKDTRALARRLVEAGPMTASYYACLQQQLGVLLTHLAGSSAETALSTWQQTLRDGADLAWKQVMAQMGMSALAVKGKGIYTPRMHGLLHRQLPALADQSTVQEKVA